MKIRAIINVLVSLGLMFAILFISAGRWDYWLGWAYFLFWTYVVLLHWFKIPVELVQERMQPGPGTKKWDYISLFVFLFPLTYIIPLVAALDGARYRWTGDFPLFVNILAFIIMFLGGSLEIVSLRTNQFFSGVIRIQKERGHYVIDKGPYAFIRHPGYAGGILCYFCIPFALNSLLALIPAGVFSIAFIIRTYLEDITLQKELSGYIDYAAKVRYRLIPGIW